MIEVQGLTKSFGDLRAVRGIDFEVAAGEIYGLLGPNGAGKTTTLSMMTGLLRPDAGHVRYEGVDVSARPLDVKAMLGVVPQETALYEDLSAREHLQLWGGLYGLGGRELAAAIDRALEHVGLSGRDREAVKRFSGGMKRRLNLALGLVHQPRAVLLDEPTVGIDPQARRNILEVVRQVAEEGATVLYTTHYLEEAEELCDRIAILDHGEILAEGTLEELQLMVGGEEVVTLRGKLETDGATTGKADSGALLERLGARPGVRVLAREADRLVLAVGGDSEHRERGSVALLEELFASGVELDGVSIEPPSLDNLFLKLTGRELRDG